MRYIDNILILKHHNTYTYFDKQEINPTRNRNSFLYQDFHFFPILKSLKDLFNRLNMNSPNKKKMNRKLFDFEERIIEKIPNF